LRSKGVNAGAYHAGIKCVFLVPSESYSVFDIRQSR
jgi:hypothetical protein